MWGVSCKPHVVGCIFERNSASFRGGAAFFGRNSNPLIEDSIFRCNHATQGGAIALERTLPITIQNCRFENNRGLQPYFEFGSATSRGGAIFSHSSEPLTIKHCVFRGNVSEQGGAVCATLSRGLQIHDSVFEFNAATSAGSGQQPSGQYSGYGGAVSIFRWITDLDVDLEIKRCAFVANQARYGGSAIHDSTQTSSCQSSVRITDSTITGNFLSSMQSTLPERPPTIIDNSAISSYADGNGMNLRIHNSIVWGNGQNGTELEQIRNVDPNGVTTVTYSCIQGLDQFVDPTNIGDDPLLIADGYHLSANSPCRGMGSADDPNRVDIDGESRPVSAQDIGVDQFVDVDQDELGDWWERKYAGDLSIDPDDDADANGLNALAEHAAERNPLLPPRILTVAATPEKARMGDYPTIQAAIDAAHPREGDTIVLRPGMYAGQGNQYLYTNGKAIELRSEAGPTSCTITPEPGFPAIKVGPGAPITIRGITFNGFDNGIVFRIDRLPHDAGLGSGISVYAGELRLIDCRFTSGLNAQAIRLMRDSRLNAKRCRFERLSFGIFADYLTEAVIQNCTFSEFKKIPGVRMFPHIIANWQDVRLQFENCTFNIDDTIVRTITSGSITTLNYKNCVFADRGSVVFGSAEYCVMPGYTKVIADPNLIGPGMIDAIPQLVDPNNGDLRLAAGSPGIDAGDPNTEINDQPLDFVGHYRIVDGDGNGEARIDMGAFEFDSTAPGDLNCDGAIDTRDINPFVLALIAPSTYAAKYPTCHRILADVNNSGRVDASDISPFITCLVNAGCP